MLSSIEDFFYLKLTYIEKLQYIPIIVHPLCLWKQECRIHNFILS